MYKLCKTEQSAARQRQLEEGLLSAMKMKRYEEITISELCDQMDIPRKSFYRYFSSKDGALHALLDHTLLEFEQRTGMLSGNGLLSDRMDFKSFFEFWYQQKQLLDALEKSGISGVLVQRAINQARDEYVAPSYMIPQELQAVQYHAVSFAICGMMSMVTQWHHDGYRESVSEMAAIAAQVMTRPLIQQKGK